MQLELTAANSNFLSRPILCYCIYMTVDITEKKNRTALKASALPLSKWMF